MATFKITKTTTVAKLKQQFRDEFGGTLRVYNGRSEASDDATLVSLGGKVGELECRGSRTVGKFIEAFQTELSLKVKVFTADNWVAVLDGITLGKVKDIPNGSTKAKMEAFLGYKREEKEEATEETATEETDEVPEELKGLPIIEIKLKELEMPSDSDEYFDFVSDNDLSFPAIAVLYHEDAAYVNCDSIDADDMLYQIQEYIDKKLSGEEYSLYMADDIAVSNSDKKPEKITGAIGMALNEFCDGGNRHQILYDWNSDADEIIFNVMMDGESNIFKGCSDGSIEMLDITDDEFEALKGADDTANGASFDSIGESCCGRRVVESKEGYYGVIDDNNNIIVEPEYMHITDFCDNLAVVTNEGYDKGVVDINGNFVIECQYFNLTDIGDGYFIAGNNGVKGIIKSDGSTIVPLEYDNIRENDADPESGILSMLKDGKWGFITKEGKIISEAIYDSVSDYNDCGDKVAHVQKNGKWGAMDANGKIVIDFLYDSQYNVPSYRG